VPEAPSLRNCLLFITILLVILVFSGIRENKGLHERGAGSRIRLGLSSALWHATPRAKLHALKLRPQFTEIMRGILCLQLMVFHYSI
jgi:hypothetical protein